MSTMNPRNMYGNMPSIFLGKCGGNTTFSHVLFKANFP